MRILKERGREIDITDMHIDARDYGSREEYIKRLIRRVRELR